MWGAEAIGDTDRNDRSADRNELHWSWRMVLSMAVQDPNRSHPPDLVGEDICAKAAVQAAACFGFVAGRSRARGAHLRGPGALAYA